MGSYVLAFDEIDRTRIAHVGGKGALLGELSRVEGILVPDGFCITTSAYERTLADAPSIEDRLDRLSRTEPEDRATIRALSADIRRIVERLAITDDLESEIVGYIRRGARPAGPPALVYAFAERVLDPKIGMSLCSARLRPGARRGRAGVANPTLPSRQIHESSVGVV